jgi:hypothetical protein
LAIDANILRYLRLHPGAKDTLEGITDWWLIDLSVHPTPAEVKAGLESLVERGLVIADHGADGRVYYSARPAADMKIKQTPSRGVAE